MDLPGQGQSPGWERKDHETWDGDIWADPSENVKSLYFSQNSEAAEVAQASQLGASTPLLLMNDTEDSPS